MKNFLTTPGAYFYGLFCQIVSSIQRLIFPLAEFVKSLNISANEEVFRSEFFLRIKHLCSRKKTLLSQYGQTGLKSSTCSPQKVKLFFIKKSLKLNVAWLPNVPAVMDIDLMHLQKYSLYPNFKFKGNIGLQLYDQVICCSQLNGSLHSSALHSLLQCFCWTHRLPYAGLNLLFTSFLLVTSLGKW